MPLSDAAIRSAKPGDKPYKLHDEGGLFVIVRTSGGKLWRLKYRFSGKEQQLTIGTYPAVGLKEARGRRDAAKKLLASGIDPSVDRKRKADEAAIAADNTFKSICDEFVDKRKAEGAAPTTVDKAVWFVALLTPLHDRPVSEIEPREVLAVLKALEKKGNHETARRVRAFAARIFRYGIVTSRAKYNPAAELGEALISVKPKHHAALIEPEAVGALLRSIDGYDGHVTTRLALRLLPHVYVRPGELRHAEWDEFDMVEAVWRIPAGKMKMRNEHVVPLSQQALAILQEASEVRGHSQYVFPAMQTWLRPMSENTLNAALRRMGYTGDEMTSHGFRSTASTLLNESGKWSPDAVERALAHTTSGTVRGIYHRGAHWAERVEMAQWWSDYLDVLKSTVRNDSPARKSYQ